MKNRKMYIFSLIQLALTVSFPLNFIIVPSHLFDKSRGFRRHGRRSVRESQGEEGAYLSSVDAIVVLDAPAASGWPGRRRC